MTMSGKRWTPEELSQLKKVANWPLSEILDLFPDRSEISIAQKLVKTRYRRSFKGLFRGHVSWPGMEGGRQAYGMSEAEWNESPQKHHQRMIKKYFKGAS